MEPFTSVPLGDIDYMISTYNLPTVGNKYSTVWNFVSETSDILVPESISNYIMAYNLFNTGVDIPVINTYDIIMFDNNFGLDKDRMIKIMKILGKLDESDPFMNLPDEVIPNIISNLDCDQIMYVCKISQRFNSICKRYRDDIFKNINMNLSDYDPVILCKASKLNNRVVLIKTSLIVVDDKGDVHIVDNGVHSKIPDVKNIISIANSRSDLYLLDSFGKIYMIKSFDATAPLTIKQSDRENVVQILTNRIGVYLLYSNGDVEHNNIIIVKNVVGMFFEGKTRIFLNKNGDIYAFGDMNRFLFDNKYLSSPEKLPFAHVKDIIFGKSSIGLLMTNNSLQVSGTYIVSGVKNTINNTVDLSSIKNITKIQILDREEVVALVLDSEHNLYEIDLLGKDDTVLYNNIKDFTIDSYGNILILTIGGTLTTSDDLGEIIIGDNVRLLGHKYIMVNTEFYTVDTTGRNKFKLIKLVK
jgi:hypothetical protein